MSTISKIPMSGYVPITNKKLNQKASNPISANNSNSRDLMSPNAHYGRHAVSFKALITSQEADTFIREFNFTPPTTTTWTRDILEDLKSKTDQLLILMHYPDSKPGALNHLSNLLTHDRSDVRGLTLRSILKSEKDTDTDTIIPDLIHPVKQCFEDEQPVVRREALKVLNKWVIKKANLDIVVTSDLVNEPLLNMMKSDSNIDNRPIAAFVVTQCIKYKPEIIPEVIPEVIHEAMHHIKNFLSDENINRRRFAGQFLRICVYQKPEIIPEVIPEVMPHIKHLLNDEDPNGLLILDKFVEEKPAIIPEVIHEAMPHIEHVLCGEYSSHVDFAKEFVNKCVEKNSAIIPEVISHIDLILKSNDIFNRRHGLSILDKCVKKNPAIIPELIPHIEQALGDADPTNHKFAERLLSRCVKKNPAIIPEVISDSQHLMEQEDPSSRRSGLRSLGVCIEANHELATPEFISNHVIPFLDKEIEKKAYIRADALKLSSQCIEANHELATPEFISNHVIPCLDKKIEKNAYIRVDALKLISQCAKINSTIATPELLNSIKLLTSSGSEAERNLAIPLYNNLVPILEKRQRHAFLSAMGVRNDIPHTDENIKSHIFSFAKERPAPPTNVQYIETQYLY